MLNWQHDYFVNILKLLMHVLSYWKYDFDVLCNLTAWELQRAYILLDVCILSKYKIRNYLLNIFFSVHDHTSKSNKKIMN